MEGICFQTGEWHMRAPLASWFVVAALSIILTGCGRGIMPGASFAPSASGSGSASASPGSSGSTGSSSSGTSAGSGSGSSSGASSSGTAGSGSGSTGSSGGSGSAGAQSSTFIFVRNSQQNGQLQVLRFNDDGSISAVSGSPFSTNIFPMAVVAGYLIGGQQGQIATFHVDPNSGAVTQVSQYVNGGASVAGTDQFVYAGTINSLYGYALVNGQLTPLPTFPIGVENNPCQCATPAYGSLIVAQGYLFYGVSADHAGSDFTVQKIEADGTLASGAHQSGGGPGISINVTPNANFIYVLDNGLPSLGVSSFDTQNGIAGPLGSVGPRDVFDLGVIDPTSSFLVNASPEPPPPFQAIGAYRIDPNTGQLTLVSTIASSGEPQTFDPSGKYILTFDQPTQSTFAISVYTFDAGSGSLTFVDSYSLGSSSSTYSPGGFIMGKF